MAKSDNDIPERIFTLAEANELLPQLNQRFAAVRRAKNSYCEHKRRSEQSQRTSRIRRRKLRRRALYQGRFTRSAEVCKPYMSLAWSSKMLI